MSLIENHKGKRMTYDNRTFSECSQRMQRITPTLHRKFQKGGSEESESGPSKIPEAVTLTGIANRSYVPPGRPIPPPRPRRLRNLSPDLISTLPGGANANSSPKLNGPTPSTSSSPLFEENVKNRDQIDLSLDVVVVGNVKKGQQQKALKDEGQENQGKQPILMRPIKHFLSLMTDIANNGQMHSYSSPP